jgi:hypothetical protein
MLGFALFGFSRMGLFLLEAVFIFGRIGFANKYDVVVRRANPPIFSRIF